MASDAHSEPRAEWPDETVEKVCAALHDLVLLAPPGAEREALDHAETYLRRRFETARPAEADDRPMPETTEGLYEQLYEAESQLAALRARCEGVAKELRDLAAHQFPKSKTILLALADKLGGPDDAPAEAKAHEYPLPDHPALGGSQ